MKDVTYTGPFEAVEDADGVVYAPGQSVSVEDAKADSLTLRDDFVFTPPAKTPKKDDAN